MNTGGDDPKKAWYLSRDHAWFAAYSPAKAPEIAVVVLVEHGGSGPTVAAPIAMQIVKEYHRLAAARAAKPRRQGQRREGRRSTERRASGEGRRRAPPTARPPIRRLRRSDRLRAPAGAPKIRRLRRATSHESVAIRRASSGCRATASTGRCSSPPPRSPSSASSTCTLRRASPRAALSDIYIQQVYWLVLGGILGAVVAVIDYRHYERLGYVLYGVGIVFLVLVFILGKDIRGSSRWIAIGSFGFQPSEFMKLFMIIALAKYLHDDPRDRGARAEGSRSSRRCSRPSRRCSS